MGFSYPKAAQVCAAFFLFLSGCASFEPGRNRERIIASAEAQGFERRQVRAGKFDLVAYGRDSTQQPQDRQGRILVVYIEGDGAPWRSPFHPPRDPTPLEPVTLALAIADPSSMVVYLGRPCQYLEEVALRQCDSMYWTERRFSPEVVDAFDEAVSRFKTGYAAQRVRLIGYSGGGVLAALLAMRRTDIDSWATIAAPLAVNEWLQLHGATPLSGSLDPYTLPAQGGLPVAMHFVGGRDKTVPASVIERFVRRWGGQVTVLPDFDHACCWTRDWKDLLAHVPFLEDTQ